ncbi:serine carboxypeptidase [Aureococcus anophagefferens]|nr:serine carboxypeptidase [Aureococcus anophagefferens]
MMAIKLLSLAAAAAASGFLDETTNTTLCDDVKQFAGYYKLTTGKSKNYFYWFFESRSAPSTDPVVLWMTGGPGCSSEVALFGENGPCKVNADGSATTKNAHSWNSNANVLYIDQPTGTGFSYGTGYDHDEVGVAADMVDFLVQFFAGHPAHADNDFLSAESRARATTCPRRTASGSTTRPPTRRRSSSRASPSATASRTRDPVRVLQGHDRLDERPRGAVGTVVHAAMVAATPPCVAAIKQCNKNHTYGACLPALEGCEIALEIPYTATGMNPYDMREKCEVPPLCYDFSNVATYLKRDDVRAALNVPKAAKWSDCNRAVTMGFELAGDYMKEYQQLIPDLIEDGIRYLIYAGDQDYICNWLGNQAWTLALPWSGKDALNAAPVADWDVAGKKAGELRKTDMFSFLRVIDAGHMVPMDQPEAALAMINAFTSNTL